MTIDKDSTPALWEALKNRAINLKCLQMDPRDRDNKLNCLPLLLIRGDEKIQLPGLDVFGNRSDYSSELHLALVAEKSTQHQHDLRYFIISYQNDFL